MPYHPPYFDHNIGSDAVRNCADRWITIMPFLKDTKSLLDLGASGAFFSFSAAFEVDNVISVEFDEELHLQNVETARLHNVTNIDFRNENIIEMEFPKVDTVFLLSVFHHLSVVDDFPDRLLRRISEAGKCMFFDAASQNELSCSKYSWFEKVPKEWDSYLMDNTVYENIEKIGGSSVHDAERPLFRLW